MCKKIDLRSYDEIFRGGDLFFVMCLAVTILKLFDTLYQLQTFRNGVLSELSLSNNEWVMNIIWEYSIRKCRSFRELIKVTISLWAISTAGESPVPLAMRNPCQLYGISPALW